MTGLVTSKFLLSIAWPYFENKLFTNWNTEFSMFIGQNIKHAIHQLEHAQYDKREVKNLKMGRTKYL